MIGPFTLNEILIAILWAETVWLAWLFGSLREIRLHNGWMKEHVEWLDRLAAEIEATPLADITPEEAPEWSVQYTPIQDDKRVA